MKLMADEKILLSSNDDELVLTNIRVRLESESFGHARIVSIMLEELASCAITRISHPVFLVIAVICFLGGALIAANGRGNDNALIAGIVLAVVFVLIYLVNRQQVLALASAGATINVNTQGMKLDDVRAFIDRAEAAKNARYLVR
jgi:hypothetical protein